jgi:hypothetical protein
MQKELTSNKKGVDLQQQQKNRKRNQTTTQKEWNKPKKINLQSTKKNLNFITLQSFNL